MSFLQPILLVALIAAGIPLILHLLHLRKLTVVPFSTLSFLKELQRSRVRAVRIRQLLLLILRTLLVLLLVLAFARPVLRGTSAPLLGGAPGTDAVILLDDSYSMSMRDENGSLIRQATTAVRSILDGMNDQDRVLVVPLSAIRSGGSLKNKPWISPREAIDRLGTVPLSPLHVSLEDAFRSIAELPARAATIQQELYVLSDLQRGLVPSVPDGEVGSLGDMTATFISVGPPTDANISFATVSFRSAIVEVGSPTVFGVELRNDGSDAPLTANISLFLETQRLDQRVTTLAGGETRAEELRAAPRHAGFQIGSITVSGDDIDFDNTFRFVLRIPEERKVLIVGDQREVQYAALALSTARSEGRTGFRITTVPPDRVSAAMLKDNDMYVVFDGTIREDILRTLLEQVDAGKGVVLVPPATRVPTDPAATVSVRLGVGFATERTDVPETSFLRFARNDMRHPLFQGIFDPASGLHRQERSTLESPDIHAFTTHEKGKGQRTILGLSNGVPFLTETSYGSGRVLTFAVSLVPEWSDVPVSGLFVPLLHRSVLYVSGDKPYQPPVEPGETITIPLSAGFVSDLSLLSPDRRATPVQPVLLPTGPVFRTDQAVTPGVYSLRSGESEIGRFAVNVSTLESDPAHLSSPEILKLCEAFGITSDRVTTLESGEDLSQRIYASRVGTELWPTFLVLALIILLLESWLASTIRPETKEDGSV